MTTIADIIAARNAAVDILNHEIQDALDKQNAAPNDAAAERFDPFITQLMTQRVAIFEQAANSAMNNDQMTAALNALRGLTSDMNTTAAQMGSVTGFYNNISDFLDAASKVAPAVKGS